MEYETGERRILINTPPIAQGLRFLLADKIRFHLQAYLFQARALIGSDETGLSDPFARVICYDRSVTTKIIMETLSPTWDQHMTIEDITIFMSHAEIIRNPPLVFIEIFDWDKIVSRLQLGAYKY